MYRCFWILHFFDLNCWTQQSNIIFDKVFSEASGTNTIYFGVCLCFFSQLIECFQKWDSGYCNRCIWIWIRFGRFRVWITNGSYPSMMGVKLNSCQLNKCYLFYRIFVIRDDMVCFDVLFCTAWSCFSSGEDFVYFCFCSIHWEMSCIVINLGKCSYFNSIFCSYIALCIFGACSCQKLRFIIFHLNSITEFWQS